MYNQLIKDYEKNKAELNVPAAGRSGQPPLLLLPGTNSNTLPLQMGPALKKNQLAVLAILPVLNQVIGGAHPYPFPDLLAAAELAADKTITFFRSA